MLQELSTDELMNEIEFTKSLQVINQMKNMGFITESEFKEIKVALVKLYRPYLAELMC